VPATTVVLLHGLSRTHFSMRRMANGLEKAGFRVLNSGYPTRVLGLAGLVDYVRRRLVAQAPPPDGEPVLHGVGHSLGGVVLRGVLADPPAAWRAGRLVTIAAPHRGARIVELLLRHAPLRRWYGPVLADLAWECDSLRALATHGAGTVEVGAIFGSARFLPLSPATLINAGLGLQGTDGTVERSSACGAPWWPPFEDCIEVRRGHTFIAADPAVIRQTVAFLKNGRFNHTAERVAARSDG